MFKRTKYYAGGPVGKKKGDEVKKKTKNMAKGCKYMSNGGPTNMKKTKYMAKGGKYMSRGGPAKK